MGSEFALSSNPGFPGPLYAQVADYLRRKIASSEWTPTTAIPNESNLARDIGVSVGTVRKALQMLETEQLIQRRQGRGTFVLEASEENDLQRFSRLMDSGQRLNFSAQSISTHIAQAEALEAARLGLRQGARVIRIEVQWRTSGEARAVEKISVPEARFPGLDQLKSMSSAFLFPLYRKRYEVVVSVVTERVACTLADSALAAALDIERGAPLLTIDRTASASSVGPVEWSRKFIALGAAYYSQRLS